MPVFTANIPGILKVGDRIEVGGKIKENARKMSINLCAQEGEEPRDVVLHFDVRFHRDNIISLSRKNGIWIGSGNYDTNYNMFVPGTIFRIVFEIKDTDVITIYCQGKFHSNFLPKIPLSMARFLVAWADVERITHCYFKVGPRNTSGDEGTPNGHLSQSPHRSPNAMMTAGDARRRSRKKTTPGQPTTCSESSEEEVKSRKGEGRADKFFYDTLMCQPPEHPKFAQTDTARFRRDQNLRRHEYERRLKETTDTEKNESEEYSEDLASRNESSMVESEDGNQGIKKRSRRVGKFGSLAQVVNFMGKTRRN